METIGKRIKDLRKELRLSQSEFAEKLLTTQDTVSLWELDKSIPTTEFIINICKTFSVSADYLLGLQD